MQVVVYGERVSPTAYHHGNLREALIASAVEAVREGGPGALSIRDLARRVGVSHNAAYRHFVDLDDLRAAVATLAMNELVDTIERRVAEVDVEDPVVRARRRLAQTGRAYVEFALAETGLFRLAFATRADAAASGNGVRRDPYLLLTRALDDLAAVGFLAPDARVGAEVACWSAMHGFALLAVEGPLRHVPTSARAGALEQVLVTLDRSYAATTGADVTQHDLLLDG